MRAWIFLLVTTMLPGSAQSARGEAILRSEGTGAGFQQVLIQAVRDADRIVVSEHANRYDLLDEAGRNSIGPYAVYGSHTLTAAQRERLIAALGSAAPEAGLEPLCLFSPHHAIEFHVGERRESKMEICFTCDQIRWSAVQAWYPAALVDVFAQLVTESGLNVEQDWRKKADAAFPKQADGTRRDLPPPDPALYEHW